MASILVALAKSRTLHFVHSVPDNSYFGLLTAVVRYMSPDGFLMNTFHVFIGKIIVVKLRSPCFKLFR